MTTPVCAHIGLMPQAVHTAGGFRAAGRGEDAARQVLADARAVAEAGAFAIVIEGTMEPVARAAAARYAADVRAGRFPATEHCFGVPREG